MVQQHNISVVVPNLVPFQHIGESQACHHVRGQEHEITPRNQVPCRVRLERLDDEPCVLLIGDIDPIKLELFKSFELRSLPFRQKLVHVAHYPGIVKKLFQHRVAVCHGYLAAAGIRRVLVIPQDGRHHTHVIEPVHYISNIEHI